MNFIALKPFAAHQKEFRCFAFMFAAVSGFLYAKKFSSAIKWNRDAFEVKFSSEIILFPVELSW